MADIDIIIWAGANPMTSNGMEGISIMQAISNIVFNLNIMIIFVYITIRQATKGDKFEYCGNVI